MFGIPIFVIVVVVVDVVVDVIVVVDDVDVFDVAPLVRNSSCCISQA